MPEEHETSWQQAPALHRPAQILVLPFYAFLCLLSYVAPFFDWRQSPWDFPTDGATLQLSTKNCISPFKPDNVLLIITNTLSTNVKDWLKSIDNEYRFNIYIWEEQDLITQIIRHRDALSEYFPNNDDFGKQVLFYKMGLNEIRLGCNKFQDAELCIINVSNYEQAKKNANEFIRFIKEHNIIFEYL